ncbi:hypothetical protein GLYMA_07G091300v4 [Glycine max]|uniref:Uncharacterized protein n=1 Tax=Glycine max TaxID=3847 RepID=K7L0J5_SOYBN|nr:hypothetical protein GLYMA_07G091300v4 [Glycine max]
MGFLFERLFQLHRSELQEICMLLEEKDNYFEFYFTMKLCIQMASKFITHVGVFILVLPSNFV